MMSSRKASQEGFFADVAKSINNGTSLPGDIRQKALAEESKATELDLMLGMIRGLKELAAMEQDKVTSEAVAAGIPVIQTAYDKLNGAAHLTVFNALPQIASFLWNKKSYVTSMNELRGKFTNIKVNKDSISYWEALEIKMQAVFDKTEKRYTDEQRDEYGRPQRDNNNSHIALDDGDHHFKKATGMCKFDLISLFGDLAESVRNAISVYEQQNKAVVVTQSNEENASVFRLV